ncbi:GNAT superfamily N-acetyltransferase [Inhella inkyongensis]|uniref:GNAT superfamily N-acetyltransferase n=1 Tax=Inhella inkyongensis TaxID=392593 RepID=A0A840S3G6_9BURK|nr:GNAT family N-acetyltransferase [Inhella inkyongensis]MBB5203211.1 GNAT superfamily N-acetyltransferase [Inhella inkyongensis]
MEPISIQPWGPEHSPEQLTSLLHRAYATLAAQGWNFTAANQSVEVTRQRIAQGQTWVAQRAGEWVGTVQVRGPKPADENYLLDPAPALYTQAGTAILSQLAVHPDCRGQGLAERLMDAAEAWAKAQGFQRVALDTALPAQALRARYQRRGYVEQGQLQWTGKTYASVLMCKALNDKEAA